ncbi:MAG: trimeric intracellular cation channel family protein [Silvanigrellaceae bacterium]|nr:trimeric intracellular cation channel family protein [Silvanigrellaceae bacterium]
MLTLILDYCGSFAFCMTGSILATSRKMDFVGTYCLAAITGFGGGFLRDLIIGFHPPTLFQTPTYWIIALLATGIVYLFNFNKIFVERLVTIGDTMGLAFFTVVGIKKGIEFNLVPYQCILLGVTTACFGGVFRDVIANRIPYIFHRDFYASVAFIGGVLFFILFEFFPIAISEFIVIGFIFTLRMLTINRSFSFLKKNILKKS